jgi:hypothetical protein
MAHFAELNENNIVIRVHVINDNDTADTNGTEIESIGTQFCRDTWGGNWIQTSINNRIRKQYAGIGMTYNQQLDMFILPQPFASWNLDQETGDWKPPIDYPQDGLMYQWDESIGDWEAITFEVTD